MECECGCRLRKIQQGWYRCPSCADLLKTHIPNQPERSKREDSLVSEIKSEIHAKMMKPLFDAYEMRCSELYGNIERDK
jgi:hypothetical protein